ncbi:MAG: PAS domain S-box protein [Candidatus Hodarchaeota archaeon]
MNKSTTGLFKSNIIVSGSEHPYFPIGMNLTDDPVHQAMLALVEQGYNTTNYPLITFNPWKVSEDEYGMGYNYPIFYNDSFIGVLIMTRDWLQFQDLVLSTKIKNLASMMLINLEGDVIAGTYANTSEPNTVNFFELNPEYNSSDSILEKEVDIQEGIINDTEVIFCYKWIEAFHNELPELQFEMVAKRWAILTVVPFRDFMTPIETIENEIQLQTFASVLTGLISFVILGVLGVIFAYYGAKKLTMPLKMLTEATKKIGKGELEVHLNVSSNDEIGELIHAFNRMTAELTQKEWALSESEGRYRLLFGNAAIGIGIADPAGNVIAANQAMLHIFGYYYYEFKKTNIQSHYVNPRDREKLVQTIQKFGQIRDWELNLKRKDGSTFIALLNGDLIQIDEQKLILTTLRDITDKKKAEEDLKFQSFMLDHVMDSIFVSDAEGELLYVNKAAYETRGYTKQEIQNLSIYELSKQIDSSEQLKECLETFKTTIKMETCILEGRHINRDGSTMPVEIHASPIEYQKKNVFLFVVRDITERLKAENMLRKSEEKFSKAFHSNPDVMVLSTLDTGEYIEVNEAFENNLGYRREEAIGKTAMELNIWWDYKERNPLINLLRKERKFKNIECHFRSKSGERRIWAVSAEIIELEDHSYILWITRDITELTKLQEEIIEKDKLAAIGQLAAGVAHELNTPLANITLIAQLLSRLIETEKQFRNKDSFIKDLQNIQEEVKICGKIVKDLLQFSRKIHLNPTRFNVKSLVNDLITSPSNASRFQEKNIEITLDIEDNLEATADRSLIVQVFQNILDNSIDALDEIKRPATINITASMRNEMVEINILDNGKGISKEVLPRIFEPFFTTKGVGKGTGLGLSICRGIIEEHKGSIKIESSVGKKTKVIIRLPPA